MHFIIQRFNGEIKHDFAFELVMARDYYEWLGKESINIVYYGEVPIMSCYDWYIPVGSVEFVSEYLKRYYPEHVDSLKPLNVPEPLFDYAGRHISNFETWEPDNVWYNRTHLCAHGGKVYCKSLTTIKDERNGIVSPEVFNRTGGCQVSEIIGIESEWRVFVFHGEILHISNYSGEPLVFPNTDTISEMVSTYEESGEAPVAYTLDVAIKPDGETVVMECHRFFSCGLYGFNDRYRLPKMLSQAWNEMIGKNKKRQL